jgi:tetratricopeptide (TPR) repeat protein
MMAGTPALLEDEQVFGLRALGFLYLRLGACDRASRLFQALAVLYPDDVECAQNLAAAELEAGHPEEALRRLDHPPLAGNGDTPLCCLLRARALWRLQRIDDAFAAMERFLEIGRIQEKTTGDGA